LSFLHGSPIAVFARLISMRAPQSGAFPFRRASIVVHIVSFAGGDCM